MNIMILPVGNDNYTFACKNCSKRENALRLNINVIGQIGMRDSFWFIITLDNGLLANKIKRQFDIKIKQVHSVIS